MDLVELKKKLIELSSNKKVYGAIAISKSPKSKYYYLREQILLRTSFLPECTSISDRINYIINDLNSIKLCKCGCGQPVNKFASDYLPGHGNKSNEVKEKKIQSCLKKYGKVNPSCVEDFKVKKIQSLIEHYGSIENAYKVISDKVKNTCLKKYGVDNVFKRDDIKSIVIDNWKNNKEKILEKRRQIHYKTWIYKKLEKLGNKFEFLSDSYEGVKCKKYVFRCLVCGNVFECTIDNGLDPRCLVCDPLINSKGQSNQEYQLDLFFRSLNLDFKLHDRSVLDGFELDFYFPQKNIAIEYNGLFCHSEKNGKDMNYHLNKLIKCEDKGIRLIQIFEDEWVNKTNIVKNRLKHILNVIDYKIYARCCEVREISSCLKNKFLNKYHIQGEDKSSIKLGLFYKNRLVSVMTFGKRRFDNKIGFELMRFCSIGSFNVIGSAGKLFSYFQKYYNIDNLPIVSYADRRWSSGNLYNQLNFKFVRYSKPNYFYLDNNYKVRYSRIKFQKHKLKHILKNYDESVSERYNMMVLNNYDRIWDCGNLVFEFI